MSEHVLVDVRNLGKKYCLDLHKSLKYGLQDIAGELFGRSHQATLRDREFWALRDISFRLQRGRCVGVIGGNGAGKSTLLKLLSGLIRPDEGVIEVNGKLGALIELGLGFNPVLTGRENININGAVLGIDSRTLKSRFDEIINFSGLRKFIDTPVGNYSSGMKVRLGFAIAIQMSPDILLVDEVLAVGDIGFRLRAMESIRKLMLNGMSTILVSHNMVQIRELCDEVIWLKDSKLVEAGDPYVICDKYEREMLDCHLDDVPGKSIEIATIYKTRNPAAEITEAEFLSESGDYLLDESQLMLKVRIECYRSTDQLCLKYGFRDSDGRMLFGSIVSLNDSKPGRYEIILTTAPGRILKGLVTFGCSLHAGREWGNAMHVVRDVARTYISPLHEHEAGVINLQPHSVVEYHGIK